MSHVLVHARQDKKTLVVMLSLLNIAWRKIFDIITPIWLLITHYSLIYRLAWQLIVKGFPEDSFSHRQIQFIYYFFLLIRSIVVYKLIKCKLRLSSSTKHMNGWKHFRKNTQPLKSTINTLNMQFAKELGLGLQSGVKYCKRKLNKTADS